MARQLFRNASKAAAWSSSFQPSSVAKLSASTRAPRRFNADAGTPAVTISDKNKPNAQKERSRITGMRSLTRFSGEELPVRIARGNVASEGPDVRNVGHPLGIAINHIAILVARHRHELGLESHSYLCVSSTQFRTCYICVVDGYKPALHRFTAFFAFADSALEPVINFARQQIFQRATVTFGVSIDDHFIGSAGAGEKVFGIEIGISPCDGVEAGRNCRAGFSDTFPAVRRHFRWLSRLRGSCFGVTIRQRDDLFRRGTNGFARRIGIVRWTLPASALAEHASQSQENEHRECQENDGVDIEHVSHAFGYRSGTSARSAFQPVAGVTTERPALQLLHPPVATPILGARPRASISAQFSFLGRTLDDQGS